jgi:predicted aminopeptidase
MNLRSFRASRSSTASALAISFGFALASGSLGCTSLHYVTQAAAGQADLMDRQVDIDRLVQGHHLTTERRELLAEVARIKAYGEKNGLAKTSSYTTYVNLERSAVVWVVSACEQLSFTSKTWSFPVTGSITYLGFFHEKEAHSFGDGLRREGWDVDVRPSPAYSTLGYFDDPVLSTMIVPGKASLGELTDTILHETLHATYFVPGQSTLNESVASFVGNRLAARYLDETRGPGSEEKLAYEELESRASRRAAKMKAAYFTLEKLYESHLPDAQKARSKARVLAELRSETHRRGDLGNATLVQYKTYGSGEAELSRLLDACEGSYPRFLRTLDAARDRFRSAGPHEDPARLLAPVLASPTVCVK